MRRKFSKYFIFLVARFLNEISEGRQVLKNLSLELFAKYYWRPTHYWQKLDSLQEKCRECENPEALYRKGLV